MKTPEQGAEKVTKEEYGILKELARVWNEAKNAGLIAGEYYSVEDIQYEHDQNHTLLGEDSVMPLDKAYDAVRWLNRVDEVTGLFDRDAIDEAIEYAIEGGF